MQNKETFKISAALKDIIGKELITDEFVAVFELVKNAFDAQAKNVTITFKDNKTPSKAMIIVEDNGNGMSYTDLKDNWLFVAYSSKKTNNENDDYRNKIKSGRVFAGAKGVGRFSCDRLGKSLNLISIKKDNDKVIENLFVNWEDFENVDSKEFININVIHKVLSDIKYKINHGTVLEISGLRDNWDRNRILKLRRSLEKLINPNQENDSNNFNIKIVAEDEKGNDSKKTDFNIVNGNIRNSIFETLGIKTSNITVKISEDGNFIETILQDRGDRIYYLKEKNPYNNLKHISIYLFQLNRRAKNNFSRLMGMPPVQYGSVFVYKNGFRIYPYGEPEEDLFKIDVRKAQGYNRFLGTRDIIGRIEIYGGQSELRETTSRDGGLVKTQAYINLVKFFLDYALKRLESYVVNIIQWGDEKIVKETGEIIPELWAKDVKEKILALIVGYLDSKNIIDIKYDKEFLNIIDKKQDSSVDKIIKRISKVANMSGNEDVIKEAKKIEKVVKDVRAYADKTSKKLEDTEQKLKYIVSQNSFLKNDISNDTKNLESILHHIELTTNFIKTDIENLVKAINNNVSKKDIFDIIKRLSRQNEKITSFSKYFKKAKFNTLSNKLYTDIIAFTNEYIENVYKFREDLKRNKELLDVKINVSKGVEFKLKFNPIDIIIVIDNLISNSQKYGATEIIVTWEIEKNYLVLYFKDNGSGIKNNIIDSIFDFGFTTSRNGSGIGLYHVKEILESLNGTIQVNDKNNEGTEFKIIFKG